MEYVSNMYLCINSVFLRRVVLTVCDTPGCAAFLDFSRHVSLILFNFYLKPFRTQQELNQILTSNYVGPHVMCLLSFFSIVTEFNP
jgi:hypothetical protein